MNWKTLKKKYPKVWESVEEGVVADLLLCMSGGDIKEYKEGNNYSRISRIAHNAAFLACSSIKYT